MRRKGQTAVGKWRNGSGGGVCIPAKYNLGTTLPGCSPAHMRMHWVILVISGPEIHPRLSGKHHMCNFVSMNSEQFAAADGVSA
jgi:hypothetical protein